jgi:hypothetical protein
MKYYIICKDHSDGRYVRYIRRGSELDATNNLTTHISRAMIFETREDANEFNHDDEYTDNCDIVVSELELIAMLL